MKRFWFAALLMLLMVSSSLAADRAGKYAIAAQFTNVSSGEFAFSKMLNTRNMLLFNVSIGYSGTSSETEFGGSTSEGPTNSNLNASLSPEYRTYLRPQSSVSPYWGVYVFAGYGSGTTETPTGGGGTSESTSSDISFGAGMSLGAELYLNKALSFAIHSRFLQFSMSTETDESGSPTVSSSYTRQSLVLSPSPALYVRIYF